MFFVEEKLKQRLNELEPFIYRDKIFLTEIFAKPDESNQEAPTVPNDRNDWKPIKIGDKWESDGRNNR